MLTHKITGKLQILEYLELPRPTQVTHLQQGCRILKFLAKTRRIARFPPAETISGWDIPALPITATVLCANANRNFSSSTTGPEWRANTRSSGAETSAYCKTTGWSAIGLPPATSISRREQPVWVWRLF